MEPGAALSGLRIVEYGNLVAGPFCARLLADAGADVIKVEPPQGDESRRRGPFPKDTPDPEWSALYLYLNANKQGVLIDLENRRGLGLFQELLQQADILVVNHPPDVLDRLQLRREHLKDLNPGLVVTAITPFGLTGPYRDYAGDDLIAVSAGGLAHATPGVPDMVSDPEREPPLRANTYIGEFLAGIHAAIATMVAVMRRELTGEGCEVDVSQQEAVAMVMPWEIAHASYLEPKRREPVVFANQPNAYLPCKDGYVVVAGFLEHHWRGIVELLGNPDWAQSEVFGDAFERARNWDALEPLILEWTMEHTGAEIAQLSQAKGVPCFPAYTVGQMVDSKHVAEREFLWTHQGPNGSTFKLPGYPVRMAATPWRLRRPAPKLGEHTAHRLFPAGDRRAQRRGGHRGESMSDQPLRGIRIADFGQVVAVPFASQVLAWLGAEVILIETSRRLTRRILPPFAEGIRGINRSGGFNLINTNKLNCTLDLSKTEGVKLARRIISISDVVVENYSTGTMERMGLGYETVRRLVPDVIYLSLGAFGRSGPLKDFAGFHSMVNLFSGLAAVTGYPGGHPRILGGVSPDLFSSCYCILAVLEALHHRSKTGEGQYVEMAMSEALTTLIPEAVADYSLNQREAQRVGNHDKLNAPHNVYRCRGDQKWVAISVATDAQWVAFCKATGHPEWATDSHFADATIRWRHQDALDSLVQAWTQEREPDEVVRTLQHVGVAAAPVLDSGELLRDPHLTERGFIAWVDHPETGWRPMGTLSWSIDGARPEHYRHAPLLGEHNDYVFGELLDLSKEEIRHLTDAEVLA